MLPISNFEVIVRKYTKKVNGVPNIVVRQYRRKECVECRKNAMSEQDIQKLEHARQLAIESEERKFLSVDFVKHSKTCRVCKKRKLLTEFPTNVNISTYVESVCNDCRKAYENN